jgi:arylsulfatase A-like enzyme
MLVRAPWLAGSTDYDGLVSLTDVTATILDLAGIERPSYMVDTMTLPALDLTEGPHRERVGGMLRQGWMLVRDRWKFVKYGGGGEMLFDMENDPQEQHNLAREKDYAGVRRDLDAELMGMVMNSITTGFADRELYKRSLSGSRSFGRPGWPRPYPTDIEDVM